MKKSFRILKQGFLTKSLNDFWNFIKFFNDLFE